MGTPARESLPVLRLPIHNCRACIALHRSNAAGAILALFGEKLFQTLCLLDFTLQEFHVMFVPAKTDKKISTVYTSHKS